MSTMSKITINSEQKLIQLLRLVKEQAADPAAAPPPPPPAQSPVPAPAAATAQPAPNVEPVTSEKIIEKLNVVRSGRSTRDPSVKAEMEQYISQFTEEEKTALLAFLEGLGQILTAGVDSSAAADPADPYQLQIQRLAGASPSTPAPQAPPTPVASVPIQVGG